MIYNIEHIKGLLLEKFAGTISGEDDLFLQDAINKNADIKKIWLEMQHELLEPKSARFINNLDENKSWVTLQHKLQAQTAPKTKLLPLIKWASIAAVLCIALFFGLYNNSKRHPDKSVVSIKASNKYHIELKLSGGQQIDLSDTGKRVINLAFAHLKKSNKALSYETADKKNQEWGTLLVPSKSDYKIILSDGTQIWLNSVSQLRFPFSFTGKYREVYIQGEAFFKVSKNAAHPFIVHTPQTDVRVIGTSFNVNTYEPATTITSLVEGSVRTIAPGKDSSLLKPGFQSVYTKGNGFYTTTFDESMELGWMQGIYYFHNTKLSEVSPILSRWFDMDVVFDKKATATQTFSGAVEKNKLTDFIQNLKISSGLTTYIRDGALHFK